VKDKEVLKLALEKVANALPAYIEGTPAREYLAVIHSALAAPVQEPVAWREALERIADPRNTHFAGDAQVVAREALATQPAAAQPVQPVAQCTNSDTWNCKYCRKTETCEALEDTRNFATPPAAQRQWVGLTDEEMQALWDRYAHMEMMRAIEAKLKEKNNG
jgi:hypothetical protein